MLRWFHHRKMILLGGRQVEVEPLTLENALQLILLLAPHLAHVEEHWPRIRQALEATDRTRPQVLSAIFTGLRDELSEVPGAMVEAMGLLLDRGQAEVAVAMTAQEFVNALPVLDEVNDLHRLWQGAQELGMIARYRKQTVPASTEQE